MNSAVLNRIALALAFVGIFVAGVLSIGEILGISVPCGITFECEKVAMHPSSAWFGIRVAYIGLAFYTGMAVFTALRMLIKIPRLMTLGALAAVAIGAITHIGLAIYAYTVIEATCYWCLSSMLTMVLLFFAYAMIAQAEEVAKTPKLDLLVTVGLAIASMGAITSVVWYQWNNAGKVPVNSEVLKNLKVEKIITAKTHILGNVKAPITIIEFGDLFCGGCRAGYPDMVKTVNESKGKIRFVFKHFPWYMLKGHELSWRAAVYSEYAAEKGKFWEFVDLVYSVPVGSAVSEDVLTGAIAQLGLNAEEAKRRVHDDSDPLFNRVFDDLTEGSELGVTLTPTFLILADGLEPQAANMRTLPMVLNQKGYRDLKK